MVTTGEGKLCAYFTADYLSICTHNCMTSDINRWVCVFLPTPVDDTRVVLSPNLGIEGSDYINANYIDVGGPMFGLFP